MAARVTKLPGMHQGKIQWTHRLVEAVHRHLGGTLGGLAASAWRMGLLITRAIQLAGLCSNDPVCAMHKPDDVNAARPLHGAACHGCVFVSETSCEQRNDLLDRSLLVETVEAGGAAFFGSGDE